MSPDQIDPMQCYNMGHNGHGINLYGVLMILMVNLHTGGYFDGGLSVLVNSEVELCPVHSIVMRPRHYILYSLRSSHMAMVLLFLSPTFFRFMQFRLILATIHGCPTVS